MVRHRGRATIVDIADELQVHPTTVSRALRGSSQVSEATRLRVQAVADRLGYVRNAHASGLVTGSSKTLGLLIPDLVTPRFAALANEVQRAASARGYLLMVTSSVASDEAEAQLIRRLIENVDGTIVAVPDSERSLLDGISEGCRVAYVDPVMAVVGMGPSELAVAVVSQIVDLDS